MILFISVCFMLLTIGYFIVVWTDELERDKREKLNVLLVVATILLLALSVIETGWFL